MTRAASLAEELLSEWRNRIQELTIIPSTGGIFEVSLDGKLIFSKKQLGRFPEKGEVLELVR